VNETKVMKYLRFIQVSNKANSDFSPGTVRILSV
jgi:hypothetical protein